MTLITIAVERSKTTTGRANDKANKNLAMKVDIVESQTDLSEILNWDSWETCIPSASEKESAIAMVIIPPSTASFECVPELKPTIRPSVVIIPEVNPKLNPVNKGIRIQ